MNGDDQTLRMTPVSDKSKDEDPSCISFNLPDERTLSIANNYWATQVGCPAAHLFAEPFHICTHGPDLADYRGVFALFRQGATAISIPADRVDVLMPLLNPLRHECSPGSLALALGQIPSAILGPAYLGYASAVSPPSHPTRALGPEDAAVYEEFRHGCNAADWDHGGSPIENPCSAVFVSDRIVALAGYEVWGGAIAHISIVTHPQFRGHGYARSAVAHLAQRSISAGLLPQYRTLESNQPSIHIAKSLGFYSYARSMAIRLARCLAS
jgi:GNAT superfamily N-acetyltransferase